MQITPSQVLMELSAKKGEKHMRSHLLNMKKNQTRPSPHPVEKKFREEFKSVTEKNKE